MTDFDSDAYRQALGTFATGVTVISAVDAELGDGAITANSFNSVSLDPPLVLFSVSKTSTSLPVFIASRDYVVHVLAESQRGLSNHFARSSDDKLQGVTFSRSSTECVVLENCAALLHCRRYQAVEAGDHWIFIVRVLEYDHTGSPPLVYHGGRYAGLHALDTNT